MMKQKLIQNSGDYYKKHINTTIDSIVADLPHDITIISGENDAITANKYLLSIFNPNLSPLLSSPCCTSPTLYLPDCSTSSINNIINIITNGFSPINNVFYNDKDEVVSTANVLGVEIMELCKVNKEMLSKFIDNKEKPNKAE